MSQPSIWPRQLPASVRNDPRRFSEVRVYDELAAQLDPRWTVFYSRPWLGETSSGAEIDGECDFVLAHPEYGVLCIEVKGGGISFDPSTEKWQSRDRHGIRHNIKDPVEQARKSKHTLLSKARAERGWPSRFVRFRHAVIFPDIDALPLHLGADKPRELFAVRTNLKTIREWALQRLSGGNEEPLGAPGLRVLEQFLAKPFQLHMPLSFSGADDDKAIQELTPQQFHILTAFEGLRRVAVSGGAGTGKTVLACEDARRQAASGLRTLITCGSERLAVHLRSSLQGTSVIVETFTDVARHIGHEAGLLQKSAALDPDKACELVLDALSQRPELGFDAVIVDEGQDFPSHAWIAVDALANGSESSVLHVYFDSNQRIYGELKYQFESYTLLPIRLSRNLRNTQKIHGVTQCFYQGPPLVADGPVGAEVRWIDSPEVKISGAALEELQRLVRVERVASGDIAVLCVDREKVDEVSRLLSEEQRANVTVATIGEFKGLESRFVVLLATRNISDFPELAYVALSRARAHLSVAGTSQVIAWLRSEAPSA